jgi:hypothetical protein
MIRGAGFTPAKRDNKYDLLQIHDGENAPDKMVTDWSSQEQGALIAHTSSNNTACNNSVPLTINQ